MQLSRWNLMIFMTRSIKTKAFWKNNFLIFHFTHSDTMCIYIITEYLPALFHEIRKLQRKPSNHLMHESFAIAFLQTKMKWRNKYWHDGSTYFARRRNIIWKSKIISCTVWQTTQYREKDAVTHAWNAVAKEIEIGRFLLFSR